MKKRFAFFALAAPALLAAGCADAPEPARSPDAAKLDRLVATLESEAAAARTPGEVPEQLAQADRVAGTVTRLSPERIDPNLVATFVAR
jgi:hypothetical protein